MNVILYIIAGVLLAAFGQFFLKIGMMQIGSGQLNINTVILILTNRFIELGIFLYGLSTVFWLISLSKKDLSYVYPFIAGTYILVLLLSYLILNEHFGVYKLAGAGIILIGLLLIIKGG